MSEQTPSPIRRTVVGAGILLLIAGYIWIAGTTGSCPSCSFVTAAMVGTPEDEDVVSVLYPESPLEKGDKVPSGVLKTASGRSVDTAKLLVGQPSVIIYYRGGWCPYCNKHLAGLVDIVDDLKLNGFQLLAISPDRPDILMDKEDLSKLSYDLLSDSSMEVARQFGIAFEVPDELVAKYKDSYGIDIEADSGQTHHLLPHPSVFIVDAKGVIRFAYVNEDYTVRLDPGRILEAAKGI